jgi:hypothetical protein
MIQETVEGIRRWLRGSSVAGLIRNKNNQKEVAKMKHPGNSRIDRWRACP